MLPLICLDVDGTLVGSAGEPTVELWEAAERARGRGQRLTLCTARLAAGPTRSWAERLDPDGWHVFHTGAARWRALDREDRCCPWAPSRYARPPSRGGSESYSWDDYVVDSEDPLAVAHAGLLGLPHRRRPTDDLDEVVRVQFVVTAAESEGDRRRPAGTVAWRPPRRSCPAPCSSRSRPSGSPRPRGSPPSPTSWACRSRT
ncbi:MAG: hypothetical protein R2711_16805 [Acidimicrobiales bacterium]